MRWTSLALLVLTAMLATGCKSSAPGGAAGNAAADEQAAKMAAFKDAMVVKDKDAQVVDRETLPGADHYRRNCALCHEGQVAKAPSKTFLQMMPADAIYAALTDGIMRQKAKSLTPAQKRELAEYLSSETLGGAALPEAPRCTGDAARFDTTQSPRITGWGFDAANSRHVPADIAGIAPADVPRLKVKWAFQYPGALRARSQPTFAFGALFVGSQNGTVYALDEQTGCVRWTFRATAEVRTPVVIAPARPGSNEPPLAFFGDLIGRVYAVNALTGALRWKLKADDHPSATITGSPAYHAGKVYFPVSSLEEATADPTYACCTFRGSVLAVDAASGKVAWKTYTIAAKPRKVGKTEAGVAVYGPSGAPIWSPLTVDAKRGVVYATTGNNYSTPAENHSDAVLAFDLQTGKIRWSLQSFANDTWNVACMLGGMNCPKPTGPDYDMGAGLILAKTASGQELLLAGRKDGTALAIDPDKHDKLLWQRRLGRGSVQGGVQWGMAADGTRLYVPIVDMANDRDAAVRTDPPHPGLYALDPASGDLLWSAPADDICKGETYCDPGILAAVTSIPGIVFGGHMDGRLRAYDAASGKVVWQYDTRQEVTTVSGAMGHGGSMGGNGPVVHEGVLYVNSGYGIYWHLPGNVLLAFSVDGK
jgi:polyvinyl alcohol dehydrogenase (cytochrome)